MNDIKSVTGLSLNYLNQLIKDRKKERTLVYNIVKKRKWTNVKSKEKVMANHSFENAAKYIRKDHRSLTDSTVFITSTSRLTVQHANQLSNEANYIT